VNAAAHLAKAEELLARVDEMGNPLLPIAKALTARAQVEVLMALASERSLKAASELRRIRTAVATNGAL
jgi:hypothetical protein